MHLYLLLTVLCSSQVFAENVIQVYPVLPGNVYPKNYRRVKVKAQFKKRKYSSCEWSCNNCRDASIIIFSPSEPCALTSKSSCVEVQIDRETVIYSSLTIGSSVADLTRDITIKVICDGKVISNEERIHYKGKNP